METVLKGKGSEVIITRDGPTVIIGERINPTGRKKLAAALASGDLGIVKREALRQIEEGADVIDVNVGAAGVDEVALLPEAVKIVAAAVDAPICIDTANPKALEAALKVCPGRPLVNSVNGEERSLAAILPLIREYKVPVIGLLMGDGGIPDSVEGRMEVARKIMGRAKSLGVPPEDLIFDCLALTVSTNGQNGNVTLGTIRQIVAEMGNNVTLGASNASFGLPDREVLNASFMSLALGAGMTCPISNPAQMKQVILATDVMLGRDEWAMRYISYFRSHPKEEKK
jgi:5-methyltetrahydrofolate--homocysteine methyltransferase